MGFVSGVAGTRGTVPLFGTGLVDRTATTYEDRIDYSNVVSYDKSAAPSEWKSVTAATYVTPGEEGIKEVGSRTERRTPCAAQHLPCARDVGTLLYICGIIFLPPAVGVKCTPA